MTTIATDTLAYVAALIDVNGRVGVYETQDTTPLPRVALSSPNMALLDFLAGLTGVKATIRSRNYSKHRCALHCEEPHDHVVSVSGQWLVNGAKATVMLAAIRPYIRLQAEDVDAALKVGLDAPKKSATVTKMQALGWPLPKEWNDSGD